MFVLYSLSVTVPGNGIKCFTDVYCCYSALCVGFCELMPSKTCCVRLVSRVFVECSGRNPRCVGAMGTSLWIMLSIRKSVNLESVQSSVIGL